MVAGVFLYLGARGDGGRDYEQHRGLQLHLSGLRVAGHHALHRLGDFGFRGVLDSAHDCRVPGRDNVLQGAEREGHVSLKVSRIKAERAACAKPIPATPQSSTAPGSQEFNNIFGDPNLFKNFGGFDTKPEK